MGNIAFGELTEVEIPDIKHAQSRCCQNHEEWHDPAFATTDESESGGHDGDHQNDDPERKKIALGTASRPGLEWDVLRGLICRVGHDLFIAHLTRSRMDIMPIMYIMSYLYWQSITENWTYASIPTMAGRPHKILLYYVFRPLSDPIAVSMWQRELCERLGLRGRIIVTPQGINGTVGGEVESLVRYIKATKSYPGFRDVDFKWSEGHAEDFPRLKVKVRDEVVAFGIPEEIKVTSDGVIGGGQPLSPQELHQLVESRGDEVVFFDGRNAFESKIGKFKNAIIPDTRTTHDFIREIESGSYDHLKSRPVVTYCTGGIRCEILSAAMKNRGFNEVYQLEGGIVRYGEAYGTQGLWEGSLYVFDRRMTVDFDQATTVIGKCEYCQAPTKNFYNCSDLICRTLTLMCDPCRVSRQSDICLH